MASTYDAARLAVYSEWANMPARKFFADDTPLWQLLERNHIYTIGEILVRTKKEVREARNLGPGSLSKITLRLGDSDLYLREEWRDRGAAIRYTYRLVGYAPARIVVPYHLTEILASTGITHLSGFQDDGLERFVKAAERQGQNRLQIKKLTDSINEVLRSVNLLR